MLLVLPFAGALVIAITLQLTRRGEDECHYVLGNLDVV